MEDLHTHTVEDAAAWERHYAADPPHPFDLADGPSPADLEPDWRDDRDGEAS